MAFNHITFIKIVRGAFELSIMCMLFVFLFLVLLSSREISVR